MSGDDGDRSGRERAKPFELFVELPEDERASYVQELIDRWGMPVRIQLPELAIVQVKTTVLIPADIQLDEDD